MIPDVQQDRRHLEHLTLTTALALENAKVDYWVQGGTLIGVYLENRVMLYDYDADMAIKRSDAKTVNSLPWQKYGLVMYEGFGGFRIKTSVFSKHRVDIFVVYEAEDGFVRYGWPHLDTMYKQSIYPAEIIYPTKGLFLQHYLVRVPKDAEKVLQFTYGKLKENPPYGYKQWWRAWWETQLWTRVLHFANYFSPDMSQYYPL